MKENEAPEKIYFTSTENGTHYYTEGIPFEREYLEYTRTDIFIKKACEWLKDNIFDYPWWDYDAPSFDDDDIVNDFRKAMEE